MTPAGLLEMVKSRFVPLLHDEEEALNALLRQALMKYQDLAGVIMRHTYDDASDSYPLPEHYLARVGVHDADRDFVASRGDLVNSVLCLDLTGNEVWPITLTYLVNLTDIDLDSYELPDTCVGLLADYLEALISIPNNHRQRRIMSAGKLDTSDLPIKSELQDRKIALEEKISASRAIISPFSFTG